MFRGPDPGPGPSPSSPPPRAATNAALFSFFASLANSFADFSFSFGAPSPPAFDLGFAGFAAEVGGLGCEDSPLVFAVVVLLPGVVCGVDAEADADADVEVDAFIAVVGGVDDDIVE